MAARLAKRFAAVVATAIVAASAFAIWTALRQGVPGGYWKTWEPAQVAFDPYGIPTITASDWERLIRAQGYVVASQRLWQMDLARRQAGGRLAEWFGAGLFAEDRDAQLEDRLALARRGVETLPADERLYCERYADGVNDFIRDFRGRWGLEYALLRAAPEPWACADSLLVVLGLADDLSGTAELKAAQMSWRRNLSAGWNGFLFTYDHPWNRPYFGRDQAPSGPAFPKPEEWLPRRSVTPAEAAPPATPRRLDAEGIDESTATVDDPAPAGSNSWAWRGPSGIYLANDPHLELTVPGIWFGLRLKAAAGDWVVGAALPGLPGVVIGMNPWLAWAFTNSGEDVDDYLRETVNDDRTSYLTRAGGADVWLPLERKTFAIKVRGEAQPRRVTGLFTHRGPLAPRPHLDGLYSRQWLPLKPGMLRLPAIATDRARDLKAFDQAMDGMAVPSQNVLVVDRAGNMGYRMSGTGVIRKVSGATPASGIDGEWAGFEPMSSRRRLYYQGEGTRRRFLASANERLWVDPLGGFWYSDDRKERIDRFLASRDSFARSDMEALQLDTESRFRLLLLHWILDHKSAGAPETAMEHTWRNWDGNSHSDPIAFRSADIAETTLLDLLLGRLRATFPRPADRQVPYRHALRRAWETKVLTASGDAGFAPFGLTSSEVADVLSARIAATQPVTPHQRSNRWSAQHPFVDPLPVLGRLFRIDDYPQWGACDVVRAETPTFGPSLRFVWDLAHPSASVWSFPVGESGHVLSIHFQDFHHLWGTGGNVPVFAKDVDWGFKRPGL